MNILLFGPPGAGKGTQSVFLVEQLHMKHISTGDLFRYNMKNNTALGKEAKSYIDKGELVPDSVTINMVRDVFEKLGDQSFILDGFPRNIPQAEALDGLLKETGLDVQRALFLEVPNDQLIRRLSGRRICRDCGASFHVENLPPQKEGVCDKCGGELYQRKDDEPEAIKKRLEVYESTTKPLKNYYETQGKLVTIDGTGAVEAIWERVKSAVTG